MPSASELDAVTVDAFGTLVDLADPVPALGEALRRLGEERSASVVRRAFHAEVAFYLPRAHTGNNARSLLALRTECARVFLESAGAPIAAPDFVEDFVGALEFRSLPGGEEALARLHSAGLALACVANWDVSLGEYLRRAGVAESFHAVVSAAEAGVQKPDPRIFHVALERLGVEPHRALHVGDDAVDREGAGAAGLAFEPTPLATLPARIGLGPP
jgi:HAD superfamily hydrolase (TIGR01509 family)